MLNFRTFVELKRVLYIFLAFYFIGLSTIQCQDKCDNVAISKQLPNSDERQSDDEPCTPFCVCSTCATFMLHTEVQNNFAVSTEIVTIYTEANASMPTTAIIPIWQPPKI